MVVEPPEQRRAPGGRARWPRPGRRSRNCSSIRTNSTSACPQSSPARANSRSASSSIASARRGRRRRCPRRRAAWSSTPPRSCHRPREQLQLSRAAAAHRGSGCTMQAPGRATTAVPAGPGPAPRRVPSVAAASIASSSATPFLGAGEVPEPAERGGEPQPEVGGRVWRGPRPAPPAGCRVRCAAARAPVLPGAAQLRPASLASRGEVRRVCGLDPLPLAGLQPFVGVVRAASPACRIRTPCRARRPPVTGRPGGCAGRGSRGAVACRGRWRRPARRRPGLHPPRNTDSRRNSTRSASVSIWWLQSTVARSVRCRASAVRGPAVSSRNRSSSRAAISATGSA